jgi:DNA-binding response OmpR family regulator
MTPPELTVLLVDGDRNDTELTFQAFRRAGFDNRIFAVHTKSDAMSFLRGEGEYADRSRFPMPHLILLDHKTPGEDWVILKWVRSHPRWNNLPVAILTGSINPADQKKAEEMGANAYHVKPQAFNDLSELIRRIGEFWLPRGVRTVNRL